jgi:hypothetical protein
VRLNAAGAIQESLEGQFGDRGLAFRLEMLSGKQQPAAVVWNALLSQMLDYLTNVDDAEALA